MVRNVIHGTGGAVIAGIGWKLGSDLYEFLKRRLTSPNERSEDDANDDDPGPGLIE